LDDDTSCPYTVLVFKTPRPFDSSFQEDNRHKDLHYHQLSRDTSLDFRHQDLTQRSPLGYHYEEKYSISHIKRIKGMGHTKQHYKEKNRKRHGFTWFVTSCHRPQNCHKSISLYHITLQVFWTNLRNSSHYIFSAQTLETLLHYKTTPLQFRVVTPSLSIVWIFFTWSFIQ